MNEMGFELIVTLRILKNYPLIFTTGGGKLA